MKKVFVFGIDGAMPEKVFGEWLDELPTIKKLMSQGYYAKLNSSIPPLSGTAWTSMTTGKRPADTGIFEYTFRKNFSYDDIHVISTNNIKEKTIWEILSEYGKKSIYCFVPITWPIKPFNGFAISGFLTPVSDDVRLTQPPELKSELASFLGEPIQIDIPNYRGITKEELKNETYRVTKLHLKCMKYLIENKEWDFYFSTIMGSDRMNHNFWRYCDEGHRKYVKGNEHENTLKEFYKFIDRELGEIIKLLDEDTTIIVLSDHGILRMHNRVNLSDWLIKEGYLVLKKPVEEKCKLEMEMIDWEKTRAWAIGAFDGEIFINLEGRESKGIVKQEEYAGLINELEERFKKILGDDGKKLDTEIFVKKRDYDGKEIDEAPDMIVYFDGLQYGCNTSLINNETLWSPQTAIGSDDAGHSKQGIFIMNSSNKKGYVGEIDILDVVPIILKEFEEGIKDDKNRLLRNN